MSTRETFRPSPDELLRRVESEERLQRLGRLKIFLGYAPRVGKSRRMFEEGVRRRKRGQDVVVCAVQKKGAEELASTLSQFEVIPHKPFLEGEGLDMEGILIRRPGVCLIDQLGFDNPPGSKYAHRWEELQQLLEHGINVVTAINLQHIAEQQDRVEQITGKRASTSVPEAFVRGADELVIVDVPAEELAAVGGEQKERARKLSMLREMALFLAADVVEGQLERYMERHGLHAAWGTQERILLCITARSNMSPMIESGRRNAERSHGQLFAISVKQREINREAQEALDDNLDLARRAGAAVHVIPGDDPIQAILDFGRAERITQVFVGHTQRNRWLPWRESPVDRLIAGAEDMDVRVFPQV